MAGEFIKSMCPVPTAVKANKSSQEYFISKAL